MSDDQRSKSEFDIFIANATYPDADQIFIADVKSLEEVKDDCLVVLDTNALLVPYSIGPESLEQIQQTYQRLVAKNRLVIPGQVACEFANNRAKKIMELFQQLSQKMNRIPKLQRGRYPLLESLAEYQQAICLEKQIDDLLRQYRAAIGTILDRIRGWTWDDPVSLLYADLFKKEVVFDPAFDRDKIAADLARRSLHHLPPGYKDSSKEDSGVGDLLIWTAILQIAGSRQKNLIFVSGDEKTDWWHRSEGQAIYPRYELVDEFRRSSGGKSFHIVQFSRFLDLFGASESVVQEIRQQEEQDRIETRTPVAEPRVRTPVTFDLREKGEQAERAVYRWLVRKYPDKQVIRNEWTISRLIGRQAPLPDIAVLDETERLLTAVEVRFTGIGYSVSGQERLFRDVVGRVRAMDLPVVSDSVIVVVTDNQEVLMRLADTFIYLELDIPGVRFVFGYLTPDGRFEELATFD